MIIFVINLGENCQARGVLESMGLKQESYPFDSCIVPFDALFKSLQEDFQDYTNPDIYFLKISTIKKELFPI